MTNEKNHATIFDTCEKELEIRKQFDKQKICNQTSYENVKHCNW